MAPKNPSWKNAIIQVLEQANGAMDYKDIAEKIVSRKIKTKVGATPSNSVNTAIRNSIKEELDKSPFEWVGKGLYRLRPKSEISKSVSSKVEVILPPDDEIEENNSTAIIHAFGMFWQRSMVSWKAKPKLLGTQQIGTDEVNFAEQKGVYLLHDNRGVVYVGRSIDRPIGIRLFEHTRDRLGGRWDRFSWFGLLNVTENGKLEKLNIIPTVDTIISTLEALLIEGLEPRQNRRRGDDFNAIEYLQAEDAELKAQRQQKVIVDLLKKAGG